VPELLRLLRRHPLLPLVSFCCVVVCMRAVYRWMLRYFGASSAELLAHPFIGVSFIVATARLLPSSPCNF
jgi:hypothetical protein